MDKKLVFWVTVTTFIGLLVGWVGSAAIKSDKIEVHERAIAVLSENDRRQDIMLSEIREKFVRIDEGQRRVEASLNRIEDRIDEKLRRNQP